LGLCVVLERRRKAQREYVGIEEYIKSRVSLGIEISRFYSSHFKPRSIAVWKYAPLPELEGILLKEFPIHGEFVTREAADELSRYLQSQEFVDRFFSVIRIVGMWVADGMSLTAYLTISNDPNWRRVYGDVEMNVFPEGDIRDLVDLLYRDKVTKERLVNFFLISFAEYNDEAHQIGGIYFTLGVASAEDLDLWHAVSLKSQSRFLTDSIARLKAVGGEDIEHKLNPYSIPFLVDSLRTVPKFDETINDFFTRHQISEKAGSLGLIGEKPDSFKDFFEEFAEKVLKPMLRDLPPDTDISTKIRNAVQRQTTLQ
jgi:hypothetical protein